VRERSHERNNAPTETGVPELEKCLIKFTRLTGASEIKKRRVVPVGAVALDVLQRGLVSLDLLIDAPK
jgi:hypothetical protein